MSFPGIIRRLFANNGAGPKLRKDILPTHADTHAPGGSDPLDLETLGGVSSDDFSALQEEVAGLIEAIGNIDPWTMFPPRLPVAIDGVTFGGSDGRRAIMPGETEAREDWILCDGGSDGKGGTVPDLRGRMIMGASDEHEAGSTGGSETHSHSISGTVGETTLTVEQIASHGHSYNFQSSKRDCAWDDDPNMGFWLNTKAANTGSSGGSKPHTHSLSGVSSEAADSLPPYYAGHYAIRV